MKLIVGLGNPGKEYEQTRHNIGYCVVDALAQRWQIEVHKNRFSGRTGGGQIKGLSVLLLKPTTYMNLSGRSVREAVAFYKLSPADLLVVADDLALPLGRLRFRPQGSAGGHNGLTSIIQELGGDDAFARLRMGIDAAVGARMVGHVLGTFSPEEQELINQAIRRAADAVECWLTDGVDKAMNTFNRPDEPLNERKPREPGSEPTGPDGGM